MIVLAALGGLMVFCVLIVGIKKILDDLSEEVDEHGG